MKNGFSGQNSFPDFELDDGTNTLFWSFSFSSENRLRISEMFFSHASYNRIMDDFDNAAILTRLNSAMNFARNNNGNMETVKRLDNLIKLAEASHFKSVANFYENEKLRGDIDKAYEMILSTSEIGDEIANSVISATDKTVNKLGISLSQENGNIRITLEIRLDRIEHIDRSEITRKTPPFNIDGIQICLPALPENSGTYFSTVEAECCNNKEANELSCIFLNKTFPNFHFDDGVKTLHDDYEKQATYIPFYCI